MTLGSGPRNRRCNSAHPDKLILIFEFRDFNLSSFALNDAGLWSSGKTPHSHCGNGGSNPPRSINFIQDFSWFFVSCPGFLKMVYFKELMLEIGKNSKQLGDIGEKIASQYLEKKDYKILDRNYSPKWVSGPMRGEIDIIAKKESTISFIEVKTLKDNFNKDISPEQKVNSEKQRKILKTAENWLMEKKIPLDSKWQIDVISVEINSDLNKAKIRHFQNAVF